MQNTAALLDNQTLTRTSGEQDIVLARSPLLDAFLDKRRARLRDAAKNPFEAVFKSPHGSTAQINLSRGDAFGAFISLGLPSIGSMAANGPQMRKLRAQEKFHRTWDYVMAQIRALDAKLWRSIKSNMQALAEDIDKRITQLNTNIKQTSKDIKAQTKPQAIRRKIAQLNNHVVERDELTGMRKDLVAATQQANTLKDTPNQGTIRQFLSLFQGFKTRKAQAQTSSVSTPMSASASALFEETQAAHDDGYERTAVNDAQGAPKKAAKSPAAQIQGHLADYLNRLDLN